MKYPCPQCGLSRQFIVEGTAKNVTGQRCRRCATKFSIKKVSARRKDFRGKTIFCSACGFEFLFSTECPSCKVPFTEYLLVSTERPRKTTGSPARNLPKDVERLAFQCLRSATLRLRSIPVRIRVVSTVIVLVLALLAAGSNYYNYQEDERNYLKNYVLTLYGINSGFDRASNISSDLVAESLRAGIAGYYPTGAVSEKLEELTTVQTEVARLMERLTNPPESLAEAGARLQQLYFIYKRQYSLVLAPHGRVDEYERSLRETRAEFLLALMQCKASFPSQLRNEVKKSGTRYNLHFLE